MTGDWSLDGMARREQSVTSDWEIVDQPHIDGVACHEVRRVPTSYGRLTEVWRADWALDDRGVDQVFASVIDAGQATGWHVHGETTDRLFVLSGQLCIVLYDGRRSSSTHGAIAEWRLGEVRSALVVVPPGVWHGVRNESSQPAVLLNAVDQAYSYEGPDHWSVPPDTPQIPYRLAR